MPETSTKPSLPPLFDDSKLSPLISRRPAESDVLAPYRLTLHEGFASAVVFRVSLPNEQPFATLAVSEEFRGMRAHVAALDAEAHPLEPALSHPRGFDEVGFALATIRPVPGVQFSRPKPEPEHRASEASVGLWAWARAAAGILGMG